MTMMPPPGGPPAGPPAGPGPTPGGPSPVPGAPGAGGIPAGVLPPGGQSQPGKAGSLSASLASPFADLSIHLPHHYQLLDVAASTIEQAINTGGFSTEPKTEAGVKSLYHQISQILANKTREGQLSSSSSREPEEGTGADDTGVEAPDMEEGQGGGDE